MKPMDVSTMHLVEPLESRTLLTVTPNDPRFGEQWGLSAVDVTTAWDSTVGSSAVVVGHIDSGVDYTHPDLYRNVWINQKEIPASVRSRLRDVDRDGLITFYDLNDAANRGRVKDVNRNGRIDAGDLLAPARSGGWSDGVDGGKNGYVDDIVGWDFYDGDNDPFDTDGHGTHTAGIIAAEGNNGVGVSGVAWRASLMVLRIFGDGDDDVASNREIAAAIRYSAANRARISNNSWGMVTFSQTLYNAVRYASNKGQLFIAAAGNDAVNIDSSRRSSYPAEFDLPNVVSVASTTSSAALSSFSNYGAATVDLAAPGTRVLSTAPGGRYATMSGTSMSVPFVTGAAVLTLSRRPTLSAATLKARLIAGADQNARLRATSVSGGELSVPNTVYGATGRRVSTTTTTSSSSSSASAGLPLSSWWALPRSYSIFSVVLIESSVLA